MRTQQAMVVKELSKSYDLSQVNHRYRIIKLTPSCPARIDEDSKIIYTITHNPKVIRHELFHKYLFELGIPVSDHHKIIKELK